MAIAAAESSARTWDTAAPTPEAGTGRATTYWLAFGAVMLFATFVRLWHLTAWDFWTDEMHTLSISSTGQYSFGPAYITAPINFILTGWSIGLLGANELGLRAVPMLAGVATTALVFVLGRRWLGNRAALLAAAFVAASPWHVAWSQTARHPSLQVLGLLLAFHFFLVFWKANRTSGLIASAFFLLFALAVHSSAIFFVCAILAFLALDVVAAVARSGWRDAVTGKRMAAFAGIGSVLLVFLPVSWIVGRYLNDTVVPWNPLFNLYGSIVFYMPPYLLLAAVAGAVFLRRDGDDLAGLLFALVVIPLVLLGVASRVTIASAPYVLGTIVPVTMLAGVALDRLLLLARGGRAFAAVGVLIVGLFGSVLADLALYHSVYRGLKPRWREASDYLAAQMAPGDLIHAAEADVAQYYLPDANVLWLGQDPATRAAEHGQQEPGSEWYVVYMTDRPLTSSEGGYEDALLGRATLCLLLPLHYGPKDRTLGVFHMPRADSADRCGGAGHLAES